MELTTLGSLALRSDGALVLARRRKTLALLAYLAVHEGTPQSRDSLARLLWPDRELARARHSLRQALAELRQALPDAVSVTTSAITLRVGVVQLDVRAFEVARAEARWDDALRYWNGEFLSGTDELAMGDFATWLAAERDRLRPLLASVVEADVALALEAGDWASGWSARPGACRVDPRRRSWAGTASCCSCPRRGVRHPLATVGWWPCAAPPAWEQADW
jgi:DNA-binding SARP family transcriptional activator